MSTTANSNFPFSLTTILAFLPAYVYFSCFVYELGYCHYYNIPKQMIDPNLSTILVFATTILGVLVSCLKVLGISTPLFRGLQDKSKSHWHPILFSNGIFIIIILIVLYVYPFSWKLLGWTVGTLAIINLIFWLLPLLLNFKNKAPLKEKLNEIHQQKDNFDLIEYLFQFLTFKERLFIAILFLIPSISYLVGNGEAMKQSQFQVLTQLPDIVFLRRYDDTYIFTNVNRKEQIVGDSLILIKLSNSQPLVMQTENLGKLEVKEISPTNKKN